MPGRVASGLPPFNASHECNAMGLDGWLGYDGFGMMKKATQVHVVTLSRHEKRIPYIRSEPRGLFTLKRCINEPFDVVFLPFTCLL